jgi:hypothetical protein
MERMEKMLQELIQKQEQGFPAPAAPNDQNPGARPTPKPGESNS